MVGVSIKYWWGFKLRRRLDVCVTEGTPNTTMEYCMGMNVKEYFTSLLLTEQYSWRIASNSV